MFIKKISIIYKFILMKKIFEKLYIDYEEGVEIDYNL